MIGFVIEGENVNKDIEEEENGINEMNRVVRECWKKGIEMIVKRKWDGKIIRSNNDRSKKIEGEKREIMRRGIGSSGLKKERD